MGVGEPSGLLGEESSRQRGYPVTPWGWLLTYLVFLWTGKRSMPVARMQGRTLRDQDKDTKGSDHL